MQIEPEIKKECNLTEALELLGLGWLPYVDNDERLLPEKRVRAKFHGQKQGACGHSNEQCQYIEAMYKAVGILGNLLRNKKVTAQYDEEHWPDLEDNDLPYELFSPPSEEELEKSKENLLVNAYPEISFAYKECGSIIFRNKYEVMVFMVSTFNVSELREYVPNQKGLDPARRESNGYTTPYIDLMMNIISQGFVGFENQVKKESLEKTIIEESAKVNLNLSDREVSMMATFLRLPEAKKGRAFKG